MKRARQRQKIVRYFDTLAIQYYIQIKHYQIEQIQCDNIFQQQMLGCENIEQEQWSPCSSTRDYAKIMVKINEELQEIMQQSCESIEKADLLKEISRIKRQHEREVQSLKLNQHLLESTHSFNIQQIKTKYDQLIQNRDCTLYENEKLREEIRIIREESAQLEISLRKCQNKIINQECLIDEYKKSVQEQINLEKEVIKVEYMQRQLENKALFEKALKSMEENYQKKISQMKYESAYREYKSDVKKVKKFCSTLAKQGHKSNLMDSFETSKNKQGVWQIGSSYSTIEK